MPEWNSWIDYNAILCRQASSLCTLWPSLAFLTACFSLHWPVQASILMMEVWAEVCLLSSLNEQLGKSPIAQKCDNTRHSFDAWKKTKHGVKRSTPSGAGSVLNGLYWHCQPGWLQPNKHERWCYSRVLSRKSQRKVPFFFLNFYFIHNHYHSVLFKKF